MKIYGIDPGPSKSAISTIEMHTPGEMPVLLGARILANEQLYAELEYLSVGAVGIEDPRAYSMQKTSQDVLETVKVVGVVGYIVNRHQGVAHYCQLTRSEIRGVVCSNARAGDREIREAVLDRWGLLKLAGSRKLPPPFEGVKADMWQAIAVCLGVEARWRAGWPTT